MADEIIVSDVTTNVEISTDVVVDTLVTADEMLSEDEAFEVTVGTTGGSDGGGLGVDKLKDLLDVQSNNLSGSTNKYVLTYDAVAQNFKFVNPDDVLDSAVGITTVDPAPAGLSTATIDYLDDALDNKIDLDAGEW